MKARTFGCSVCDFEVDEILEDDVANAIVGTECGIEGCVGHVIILPSTLNIVSGRRTNIKTSGWFRERSQDMKRAFPKSKIGTGAASI